MSDFTGMEDFEFKDDKLMNPEKAIEMYNQELDSDDLSLLKNQLVEKNTMGMVDKKQIIENFKATKFLVKISTFLINCDLIYAKVMSFNFQAVFSVLLDKSIGNRDLALMDTIFFFYANFYDIVLLKNKRVCVEQLKELIRSFAEKFLMRIFSI